MNAHSFLIGTAGWTVPSAQRDKFPDEGTHLERYAAVFPAVEINSSFHRPHRPETYAKWASSVPARFRFAVKIPKTITHEKRFQDVLPLLDAFVLEIAGLGKKLGCLLVQLPPSFAFEPELAAQFFEHLRGRTRVDIACEPRHASWFEKDADALLKSFDVARAAADPARVPAAAKPGGGAKFCYYRLHGSPRMYYSQYSETYIKRLARELKKLTAAKRIWCMFDNTTLGAATPNALELQELVSVKK